MLTTATIGAKQLNLLPQTGNNKPTKVEGENLIFANSKGIIVSDGFYDTLADTVAFTNTIAISRVLADGVYMVKFEVTNENANEYSFNSKFYGVNVLNGVQTLVGIADTWWNLYSSRVESSSGTNIAITPSVINSKVNFTCELLGSNVMSYKYSAIKLGE